MGYRRDDVVGSGQSTASPSVMARLVRARFTGTLPRDLARTSRAMTRGMERVPPDPHFERLYPAGTTNRSAGCFSTEISVRYST